jgi:acetyl esterase/lipase
MSRVGLSPSAGRTMSRFLGAWVFRAPVPVAARRRRMELATRGMPLGPGVTVAATTLGGVPCERIEAAGGATTLLYLHGGAYVVGSPRTHRAFVAPFARALGATAWVLDYRLAPEHPYPAAVDDALAAYRALLASGVAPERLVVAGESAGGALTLALGMALRDAGDPLPAVLGVMCPWIDLTADLEHRRRSAPREPILSAEMLVESARDYLAGADPRTPLASPVLGDLRGLPPIVLSSAADDLLIEDSDALEQRAREQGAMLVHQRHRDVWHAFQAFAGVMPRAHRALDVFADELRARVPA